MFYLKEILDIFQFSRSNRICIFHYNRNYYHKNEIRINPIWHLKFWSPNRTVYDWIFFIFAPNKFWGSHIQPLVYTQWHINIDEFKSNLLHQFYWGLKWKPITIIMNWESLHEERKDKAEERKKIVIRTFLKRVLWS